MMVAAGAWVLFLLTPWLASQIIPAGWLLWDRYPKWQVINGLSGMVLGVGLIFILIHLIRKAIENNWPNG